MIFSSRVFRHRVFGILGDLSEDVASQFGEILGQLAPLLLGEVVGKGETALDCLPFVVPASVSTIYCSRRRTGYHGQL